MSSPSASAQGRPDARGETGALWASRALTPRRALERVRLVHRQGRIVSLRAEVEAEPADDVWTDSILAPGLVDLQVNGGAGAAFDDPEPEERRRAARFHLERGTTSLLATLVSAPLESLLEAAARIELCPPVVGLHLEGPFLSPEKAGAHSLAALVPPTRARVDALVECAGGVLRMLTLAPELPGALDAIARLREAGVVVAAGHSRATLERVRAGIERGLGFVTHLGNASDWPSRSLDPELGFRTSEPGLVGSFLVDRRLRGSVIADGVHLHPELIRALVELRGPASLALVSDATPAAGLPPGRYRLGAREVRLHPQGFATAGEGLAGSTQLLIDGVRVATRQAGLPLATALEMATSTPAAVLGLSDRKGTLEPGSDADLLVLGADLEVRATYLAGARV
ncbi:MAG: N-acetylglucosamine-6-phosphate deacetylase [Myxococcota bacterium]